MRSDKNRRHRVARETETSLALRHARRSAGLSVVQVARALALHPRTVRRWESGEAIAREAQWVRIFTFYAGRAPAIAETLAVRAKRVLPHALAAPRVDPPPVEASVVLPNVDPLVASHVVATAADTLDLAPKKVREVLRAAARAALERGVSVEGVILAGLDDAAASVG